NLRLRNEKIPVFVVSGTTVSGAVLMEGNLRWGTTSAITIRSKALPTYGYLTASLEAPDSCNLERMKCAPNNGATVVPMEPTPWIKVNLEEAVLAGPSAVMYGLAATCNNTMPMATTNSAARKT